VFGTSKEHYIGLKKLCQKSETHSTATAEWMTRAHRTKDKYVPEIVVEQRKKSVRRVVPVRVVQRGLGWSMPQWVGACVCAGHSVLSISIFLIARAYTARWPRATDAKQ
jgi:hypothetical protein